MPKFVRTTAQDAELADITAANIMHFCSAQPANYAGIAAVTLANTAPTFTGPAAGSPNGRQITVGAVSGVPVTASGNVLFVVLANTTDSTIRAVTTCPSQAVVAGGTISASAFVANAADPT